MLAVAVHSGSCFRLPMRAPCATALTALFIEPNSVNLTVGYGLHPD